MGEYFDICIYDSDLKNSSKNLSKLRAVFDLHKLHNEPCKRNFPSMADREMCVYNVEYNDFVEQMICFDDFKFKNEFFYDTVKEFTEIVNICFETITSARIATSIYALTGHLTPDNAYLSDIDKILHHFPFVFMRKFDADKKIIPYCTFGDTVCFYNPKAQRLTMD